MDFVSLEIQESEIEEFMKGRVWQAILHDMMERDVMLMDIYAQNNLVKYKTC